MKRRLLIGLLVFLGAFGVLAGGGYYWLQGRPLAGSTFADPLVADIDPGDLVTPSPSEFNDYLEDDELWAPDEIPVVKRTTPPLRHTLNVLLVGIDRRPGATRGGRTDTLLVAVFDDNSDHMGIVSIPRDLYVTYPDYGPARINASFSVGRKMGKNGMELLKRVVSDTLAMPIHHSVAVDMNVFEKTVDALGGVTVNAPCPIQDNFIDTRTETGRRWMDVKAGVQHLDGVTAAMYVRSRHGRSDWDRARRQQLVLMALKDRLLSMGGIARVPSLWDQLGTTVATDMNRLDMFAAVRRGLRISPEKMHGLVLGHRHTEHYTTDEGRWVLVPNFKAIDASLRGLFSAPSPGKRPAKAVCPPADIALHKSPSQRRRRGKKRGTSHTIGPTPQAELPVIDRAPSKVSQPPSSGSPSTGSSQSSSP